MKCRRKYDRKAQQPVTVKRKSLVIDGNNVAYHLAPGDTPRTANLLLAYQSLMTVGFKPVIVISSALVHSVDKPQELKRLVSTGIVIEAPRGTNDDLTIIKTAKKQNADVVSNDRFLDWIDRYPWLSSRLRKYRMTPSGLILL
jgi:hypothetical protein